MRLVKHKQPKMAEKDSLIDPNYEFVDVVDTEIHEDITSIENLNVFGLATGCDEIVVLTALGTEMAMKGGFANLSPSEKNIIVSCAICTLEEALTHGLSESEFDLCIDILAEMAMKGRKKRIERIRKDMSRELKKGRMTYAESNALLADTRDLFNDYITGNNPAFKTWVETDFSSKPYFTEDRKNDFLKRLNGK
jgi:hypothetical protein